MSRYFSWRHVVNFEETNLVGNVYFANHVKWQGICREMFLRENAPEILDDLKNGLALVTVRCACDYLEELEAFDQVELRMYLSRSSRNQVTMDFEYIRHKQGIETLVAKGTQTIASMRRIDGQMTAVPLPPAMAEALEAYQ